MAQLFPLGKAMIGNRTGAERWCAIPVWTRWLALVTIALILGTALRIFASQSTLEVRAWLPWLNQPTVILYFMDSEGLYLVPVSRPISSNEDLPRLALIELIGGPKERTGLLGTLPPSTKIRSFDVQNGAAYVDLSEAFLSRVGGLRTSVVQDDIIQAATAVEKTLTALPGVEKVILTVEGQPLEVGVRPVPAGETAATLYFVQGDYLVPVNRLLSEGANTPQQAMQVYLHGPPADGPLSGLPPGTELLNFELNPDNGLARVNLTYTEDVRALAIAEPEKTRRILTSIIFTLTEFSEVRAVMLDFEGHAQLGLGQCRNMLRTPQLRPTILNDERLVSNN